MRVARPCTPGWINGRVVEQALGAAWNAGLWSAMSVITSRALVCFSDLCQCALHVSNASLTAPS